MPFRIKSRAVLPTGTPVVFPNTRVSTPLPVRIFTLDWSCTTSRYRHCPQTSLLPGPFHSVDVLMPRSMANVNKLCHKLLRGLGIVWIACWEHTPSLFALSNDQLLNTGWFQLLESWEPSSYQAAPELHTRQWSKPSCTRQASLLDFLSAPASDDTIRVDAGARGWLHEYLTPAAAWMQDMGTVTLVYVNQRKSCEAYCLNISFCHVFYADIRWACSPQPSGHHLHHNTRNEQCSDIGCAASTSETYTRVLVCLKIL
jgi:hypothetical protein